MKRFGLWFVAAGVLALAAGPATASGFSVYEQSAKASAQAGAWTARADDPAANWYNPAALIHLDGMQVQFGANLITVGSDTEFTSGDPEFGLGPDVTFQTEGSTATPPHVYFSHKVNDRVAWGVGINTPFGLLTEWSDLPVTLSSRKAELVTFVINPNLAYGVSDTWSVGFGISYMFADVTDFSRDLDQSALLMQLPLSVVGRSNLTGDGTDWGWDVALQRKSDRFMFGLTYRSELSPLIEGNVEFTDIDPAIAPLFPDGPGSAMLKLPAQAAVGFAYEFNDNWTAEFDITWAEWSSFDELFIDFENETVVQIAPGTFVPVVEDITLREDWDDTKAYRLGAAYKLNQRHELRFGVLTDESPVPLDTMRPSIPDADRDSVQIGYGFLGEKWNIDAYYMPVWFDDITAEGSAAEGVIDGEYTSFVHLAGVTFNYRF